jgi:hypothetical protein
VLVAEAGFGTVEIPEVRHDQLDGARRHRNESDRKALYLNGMTE